MTISLFPEPQDETSAFTVSLEDGVAILSLDVPGEPVNTLGPSVAGEFERMLARLREDGGVQAIVLISGKADGFIAGADIDQFVTLRTAAEGEALSRQGQEMITRVEQYPKPVVVAIHGACMGAGLELSLACAWRIATDHPKTQLGLPEVQIGILPGAGGCQRLPRLIGLRAALDMILPGKAERAAKALKLGLIDELVHPAILRDTAIAAAKRLATSRRRRSRARRGVMGVLLDGNPLGRRIVYRQAEKQVRKKTGGHYPAPLGALEAVRTGLEQGREAGFRAEARLFGALAVSDVSRQLVRIFFATNALKKDDGVPSGTPVTPHPVHLLGVIGAGFMGAGIAGTAVAAAGVETRLKDADLPHVGKGIKAALSILDGRLKRRRMSRYEHRRLSALVSGDIGFGGFGRVDLVIEAVFEDLEVKRQVLGELESHVRPEAIIATNTSTIPIHAIAEPLAHPERVLGMHFFSPVDRMPLLEVIPAERTAPSAIVSAVRFGRKMGKTVIVVADRPGFWVNRILSPYMNEAGHLLMEGVRIEEIDAAMTHWGFPVGPVTLLDEVGLDVGQKAGQVMYEAFGERLSPADVLNRMLADGRKGRKSGRGFFQYQDGKKAGVDETAYRVLGVAPLAESDRSEIERRLVHAMLNEAAMAVGEGVVRSPRDGDIGAIFGIGYPPFRGGPLRTIDALGAGNVVDTLEALATAHGDRFIPADPLVERARLGARYYDD